MNSKKEKKIKKVYEQYSPSEKIEKILDVRKKLKEFGLDSFEEPMNIFKNVCKDYISNNIEFTSSIKFPGTQRVMECMLKNSKKYEITVVLKYNPNI